MNTSLTHSLTHSLTKPLATLLIAALVVVAGFASSANAAPLWTPAEISNAAWWDASDTSTITGSPTVTAWNDKSGNNNHFTAVSDPQTDTRTIGGLNAIDFDRDSFNMTSAIDLVGKSYFAVLQVDDVNDGDEDTPLGSNGSPGNSNFRFERGGAVGKLSNNTAAYTKVNSTTALSNLTPALVGMLFDTDNMSYVFNGGSLETGGAYDGSSAAYVNAIGARGGSQDKYNGLMGEIIITDSLPDLDTRQLIEGYLAHKWDLEGSLPETHTYKDSAPIIPEPTSLALLGLGGLLIAGRRRRRRRN